MAIWAGVSPDEIRFDRHFLISSPRPEQITDQRSQVTGHINSLRGWWRGQKLQSNLTPTFLPLTAPSKSTWCYRKSKSWPIFWLAPFFLCAAEKHKCFQPCFKKSLNILHSTHICMQFLAWNRFWRYSSNICWQYSHQMSLIDMFYSKNDMKLKPTSLYSMKLISS